MPDGKAQGGKVMSNIIPIRSVSRADVDQAAIAEQMDKIPGVVDFDLVIKAQFSAPQVSRRIAELEDCLWAVANDLMKFDPWAASAERAKLLLKNQAEVGVPSRDGRFAEESPAGAPHPSILPFGSKDR